MTQDKDAGEPPEKIRIRVAITDPNAADGETIHQQWAITETELETVQASPYEYVKQAIQEMGRNTARKWADEREGREHADECQRDYGAWSLALYSCPECGHGWHPTERCDNCNYAVCWCVGHEDYPPIGPE